MATNLLEKSILRKVDELIEIIIELSSKNNNYLELKKRANKKATEIIPLILHFIEGNISLLEPMLYQLVMEKLPDPKIISSFGNLQEEVNLLISEVVEKFQENPNKYKEEYKEVTKIDDNITYKDLPRSLKSSVCKAFPNTNILFNYQLRGEILDIYIPEFKIALIPESKKNKYIKLNYFCKKLDIKLIQIPDVVALDYRKLLRFIKQSII
ncbi:MAG: hypothetical protein PWP71_2591 [Clostridia bacterium]|jgi:hypothetical protein|nr:hypothetical protein [Clostridia bacterium]